jgi:hypothetical protein
MPQQPTGNPVPGKSTMSDIEWALNKIRRYIFKGGKWTPELHIHLNRWLDYFLQIKTNKGEDKC